MTVWPKTRFRFLSPDNRTVVRTAIVKKAIVREDSDEKRMSRRTKLCEVSLRGIYSRWSGVGTGVLKVVRRYDLECVTSSSWKFAYGSSELLNDAAERCLSTEEIKKMRFIPEQNRPD